MPALERSLLLSGLMATLSGIGLSRFAYTALMPQLVQAHWFSAADVAYLGALNLLGYLLGALAAALAAQRWGALRVLALCWWVVALSFMACAQPGPLWWWASWRLLAGAAGAALMVLGPSVALAAVPPARRAALGPLVFCGVGLGALASATLVPLLAQWQLGGAWMALAMVAALTAALGVRSTRQLVAATPAPRSATAAADVAPAPLQRTTRAPVALVLLAYALDGFGFVPHTVFWVDYLQREQAWGSGYAGLQWALFGLGAMLGPWGVARSAHRWGWWRTAVGGYALKACAIALPLCSTHWLGHALSGVVVGALSPGMAAITSGYLMQLVGAHAHPRWWGAATAVFALLQAVAGGVMAHLAVRSGSYQPLFALGAGALLASTCLVAAAHRHTTPSTRPQFERNPP